MARKYWWQKVGNPDAIVQAARRPVEDRRIRYSTVIQQAGLFRDEPEILRGLMDNNVPLALAKSAFNSYSATKQQAVSKRLANAGFSATNERKVTDTGYLNKSAEWDRDRKEAEGDSTSGVFGWVADRVLDVGQVAQTVGTGIAEGATWAWNRTVAAPLAAGYASDTALDEAANPTIEGLPAIFKGAANVGMGIINWGEGVGRLVSGDVSDEQRYDMSHGLNPDRFGDRVNFYSQDFGEVRSSVNDDDVEWLKGLNRWSPTDVDAAREVVTSGAMEDLSRSFPALSQTAQDLVLRASKDEKVGQLLSAMADSSQNSIGGRMVRSAAPDAAPGDTLGPGSVSRGVASAAAEIIATWHLDPGVLASSGYKAVRAARFGVGGMAAEKVDKTIQMLKASDDNYAPQGALASRFHDAMQTADDIVVKGVATPEAAKLRASWIRRFPGYDKTLDLLIGQRTGSVGRIRIRTMDEARGEVRHAAESGRDVNPWVMDASPDGKPLWRFTNDDGTKLSDEEKAVQRANVAEELSAFIVMDAYASGREITGSRLLLPGQLSLNGKVRDKLAPVLEAFNRRDASVVKQLKAVGKKPIDLDGAVLADDAGRWDQLVSPDSAEWLQNHYTFGITHAYSRGWRAFEKTFSNKTILPSSPDSVKVYGQLVSQFLPKRQAQMVTTQYAAANPAERWAMTRQTIGSLLNVMNLRNTPESQKIVDQLTKGLVPEGEYIQGYKAGVREYYTTPDGNNIKVGNHEMPAAVHPWQLSEGVELPNWRELRGLANRSAIMNAVTRTADGQVANALVRLWKGSKVTTPANMARQGLELEAFNAWMNPGVLKERRKARKAVKADTLQRKANDRDLERLANEVNDLNPDDLDALEDVRTSKPETYVKTLSTLIERNNGMTPRLAETMARLSQDVNLAELAEFMRRSGDERAPLASKTEARAGWLAFMGPYDTLRRIRAARHEKKGGDIEDSPMAKHLDGELVQGMVEAAAKQFGSAAEAHAWNMAERATHIDRKNITDSAGRNISFRPVKLVNGYQYTTDITGHLWAAELGRRQADPIGRQVLELIAKRHLENAAEAARPKIRGERPVPSTLDNPDALMARLYLDDDLGATMRANSAAMQYLPDGKPVRNPADRQAAAQAAARRAVNDLVHHMGGRIIRNGNDVDIRFPEESRPLLEKLAAGDEVSAKLLSDLGPAKPEGLVAPIYAPMIPSAEGFTHGLSNVVTRAYGAVVAGPLDRLFIMPTYVANRRIAQDEWSPMMDALVEKGYSPGQAAFAVEAAVNKRAVAKTFQGTDNPMEKSVFSEMADKWLMFQRAQEDFLRRLLNATRANPEGLARANILMQAGVHAGIVHYEPFQDEEGNAEYHLTFTYPGTALAQRVMADAAVGLGLAPDEILRVPQFDGLKSQVRFLNPGFSNPLQFSANPIFGFAMTGAEKLWPNATVELERLRRGFSGGEDFEGTEGPFTLKNLTPSLFQRFTVFATKDDADAQFQSATRAALMYAELAGQTPPANASPSERARFLDAVKATTTNIMIQRAVFGMFLPASPQIADPDAVDLDVIARAQGLSNLRSEFFDIRNELAKKYPDNFFRADSEAVMEFARRYPGELIVNPSAFSTGSTQVTGLGNEAAEGFVPYAIEATRWMFDNLEFVKSNPTLAIALMPKSTADGDFSNEAYKLQLKSDVRTHKNLQDFYEDILLSDDIDEYYSTRSRYFEAANESPNLAKSIYARMDDWEDGWRRAHPLADQEINRRANPDHVHSEIAPALARLADGTDPLPASMKKYLPQIKEMWQDYNEYRDAYAKVDYYDNQGRRDLNKEYQQRGDLKWLGASMSGLDIEQRNELNADAGSMSGLWNLMRVTEGR